MALTFLDRWFTAIKSENGLPRVYDKKLTIVALSALMEMGQSEVPESLGEAWKVMVSGALKVFEGLPKAIASEYPTPFTRQALISLAPFPARKELEDTFDDDDDFEDDDDDYLNMNEDEGTPATRS